MEEFQTIHFKEKDNGSDEMTVLCSVKMALYYFALSIKKIVRIIDRMVHVYAWKILFAVALFSILVSSVYMRRARVECDKSWQRQYRLEQQVETLKRQLNANEKDD